MKMQQSMWVLACATTLAVAGCGGHKTRKHPFEIVFRAASTSTLVGTLEAFAMDDGVHLQGRITGLQPGSTHGFHIRASGDCSAPDGSSAGGHFNPSRSAHGDPAGLTHHAGDMPNLVADAQGAVEVDTTVQGVTLGGGASDDVVGHAVVVDRDADDYSTQPDGNSGPGLACGVILKKP